MPKTNKIPTIAYRRKREGKTNYKKRISILKGSLPRLIVRKFNKNIIAQIITYAETGDKTETGVHSKELEKYGWKISKNNLPASYLTGLILAKKSKTKKAVLDLGLQQSTKGSKLYATVKGCIDGGMNIEISKEVLPLEDRISGKHISADVEKLFKETKEKIMKN